MCEPASWEAGRRMAQAPRLAVESNDPLSLRVKLGEPWWVLLGELRLMSSLGSTQWVSAQ